MSSNDVGAWISQVAEYDSMRDEATRLSRWYRDAIDSADSELAADKIREEYRQHHCAVRAIDPDDLVAVRELRERMARKLREQILV